MRVVVSLALMIVENAADFGRLEEPARVEAFAEDVIGKQKSVFEASEGADAVLATWPTSTTTRSSGHPLRSA